MDNEAIFSTPQAFETYYTRISDRLRERWETRMAFLTSSLERLEALRRAAEAVLDAELAAELADNIDRARRELASLKEASPTATAAAG